MIAELSLIKIAAAIILSGIAGCFALLFIEMIFNSIIEVRTQKDPAENREAIEELVRNLESGMDLEDCRVDTYDLEWLLAESRKCGWWKVISLILVTGLVFELFFKSYL